MLSPSSKPEPKAPSFPFQGAAASQPPPYAYYPDAMAYPGATDQPQPYGRPPLVTYYVPPQPVNHCAPPRTKRASSCKSDASCEDKCEGRQAEFKCPYCNRLFMHRMKRGEIRCTTCAREAVYGPRRVKAFAYIIFAIIMLVAAVIVTGLVVEYDVIKFSTLFLMGVLYLLSLSGIVIGFSYFCSKKAILISTPQALGECNA